MKAEEMTKEELLAAREIHEKTGATLKVAKIDELLDGFGKKMLIKRPVPYTKPVNEIMTIKDADDRIKKSLEKAVIVDNNALMTKEAYDLKMSGEDLSWKEIGDRVGLKAQGLYAKVKKYARENELPYE
jgi:hypothetical protein